MELPLTGAGLVATEERDGVVHLRHVEGNVLVMDPVCGDAETFVRIITPTDALTIRPENWCVRCFPRVLE